jgi:hypothetical protein
MEVSRDALRMKLKGLQASIMEALAIVEELRSLNKKRIEYRYTDVYLGQAFHTIELARIVMRKKKREISIKMEAPMVPLAPVAPKVPHEGAVAN